MPQRGHAAVAGIAGPLGRGGGGGGVLNGPGAGMPPRAGGGDDGGPSGMIVGPGAGIALSELPQLRQNFMYAGFSPRHIGQMAGNPCAAAGVCIGGGGAAIELPQFKQNDDPAGLSWPHKEQRISPPTPDRVSQHSFARTITDGWFASVIATC